MKVMYLRVALVSLGVALLAAAPASAANLAASRRGVDIVDFAFERQNTLIHVGDSIRWNNHGEFTHTTDSDDLLWDAELAPGQSFVFTFDTAGTFTYFCDFHPFMTGSIVVRP